MIVVGYGEVSTQCYYALDMRSVKEVILTVKVGFSTAELVTDSTTLSALLVASSAADDSDEAASSASSATSALAMAA